MKKTSEGNKSFWYGVGEYSTLCLWVSLILALYLYEPFLTALNTYLTLGDLVPLILLFDLIGILLCFAVSWLLLDRDAYSLAWLPFALGTLFVLPKLAVLHLGLVAEPLYHFLSAYTILIALVPGSYFGWRISRAAMERREEDESRLD
ncbi:MAG: hypothetical protein DWQ07_06660 [Chloroflexi bacterium]|nr:MAG: hypothetical protein DWQ07_06660 [Chloroflexota bacterium]MBL1195888.1 hypothetical protein [Chloroflexota bacterium]NOH13181.1 hypothetical protein [Chloroflexota bacterium]